MQFFLQNKKSFSSGPNIPYSDVSDGKTSVKFMFTPLFIFVFVKMQSFMQNYKTLNLSLKAH